MILVMPFSKSKMKDTVGPMTDDLGKPFSKRKIKDTVGPMTDDLGNAIQ